MYNWKIKKKYSPSGIAQSRLLCSPSLRQSHSTWEISHDCSSRKGRIVEGAPFPFCILKQKKKKLLINGHSPLSSTVVNYYYQKITFLWLCLFLSKSHRVDTAKNVRLYSVTRKRGKEAKQVERTKGHVKGFPIYFWTGGIWVSFRIKENQ